MADVKIKKSVGAKGKNDAADVERIQKLLNLHKSEGGYGALSVDGKVGKKTIAAIKAFQSKVANVKADGMVDPGKATIAALNQKPGAKAKDASKAGAKGGKAEEEEEKDALLSIEEIRKLLKLIAKANKRYIFAFAVAGKAELCVLYLKRIGGAKKISMFLKKETGLPKVTYGVICPDAERNDTLVFELEGKQLPGLQKKGRKFIKKNKLLPFKDLKLMVGGEEVSDLPDDEDESDTKTPRTPRSMVEEAQDWSPTDDLSVGDTDELFDLDYMDEVMAAKPKGANSPKLNEAMEELTKKPSADDVKKYLAVIVKETDLSESQAQAQWKKFLVVRKQAENTSKGKEDIEEVPLIDEEEHGSFLGTTASLRFGKVIGDNFGLHPVFGAMLSPTGGMVGGGNSQIPGLGGLLYDPDNPDDPLVKHGIVHDAAGYLNNYHDQGPGYDYLDREDRDTAHEMTGQESGINYWYSKEDYKRDTTLQILDVVYKGMDHGGKEVYDLVSKGKTPPQIEEAFEDAKEAAEEAYEWSRDQAEDAYDWADETVDEAAEAVGDGYEEAKEAAEEAYDWSRDKAEEAYDEASDIAEEAAEAAGDAADWASDKASDVADTVEDAVESTADAVGDAYDYGKEKLGTAMEYWDALF